MGISVRSWILLVSLPLFTVMMVEGSIRFLRPEVNFQGADRRLFEVICDAKVVTWKKGARGCCFGQDIHIDSNRCRVLPGAPKEWKNSLLLLGDSVTFGVGVEPEKTFAGLIQMASPERKVWNAGVVGMDLSGYQWTCNNLIQEDPAIRKVILFFSLNDIYSNLPSESLEELNWSGPVEMVLNFMRMNCKAYLFFKGKLLDRSQSTFLWDYRLYRQMGESDDSVFEPFHKIREQVIQSAKELLVVLLPMEYQLRQNEDRYWYPQQRVKAFLDRTQIQSVDAGEWFLGCDQPSSMFYLFSDGIHLSGQGHRLVAEKLIQFIAN